MGWKWLTEVAALGQGPRATSRVSLHQTRLLPGSGSKEDLQWPLELTQRERSDPLHTKRGLMGFFGCRNL